MGLLQKSNHRFNTAVRHIEDISTFTTHTNMLGQTWWPKYIVKLPDFLPSLQHLWPQFKRLATVGRKALNHRSRAELLGYPSERTSSTSTCYALSKGFLLLLQMENTCHQRSPLFTWNTGTLKDRISSTVPPRLHSEATSPTHLLLLAPLLPGQEHQIYLSDGLFRTQVFD